MSGTEVAKDYCERFPRHGDLTIAKKLYKENSLMFKNVEVARSIVRHVRGHNGKRSQKVETQLTKPITKNTNPYKLPESHAEPKEPFKLPLAHNNILLISDLHIPYHDIPAINAALDYGKEQKINTVIINGDLIDNHNLSRFEKDPRKRSCRDEFDAAKEFMRVLRKTFPDAAIYFIYGNHDIRYEKWLMAQAPEVFNDPYYSFEERLQFNEEKIKVIKPLQLVKAGKLFISHGDLFFRGFFASVNAARGLYVKAKASTICGHTHSVSEHTEKTLKDELITCWTTGCLCELKPDYAPYGNKYSHGFAHIKTEINGNFSVKNYRINNGKIL